MGFLLCVLLFGAPARAAESRDHSFAVTLPDSWRLSDPAKLEGEVLLSASSKKHPEESLIVSRITLGQGQTLKKFAEGRQRAIHAKSRFGPSPSPVRAVELTKGRPPAWGFRAGDAVHRYEIVYFHFEDSDYSAVCPVERAADCRVILGSFTLPSGQRVKPVIGAFELELPAGWRVLQNTTENFEFGRPQGQSMLLRALQVPESVAQAPTLEGDLQRSLTALAPKATLSHLKRFRFDRGKGLAVWVAGERGAQGSMLSGVVWSGGKSYRIAIVCKAEAEALAERVLSSWKPAP